MKSFTNINDLLNYLNTNFGDTWLDTDVDFQFAFCGMWAESNCGLRFDPSTDEQYAIYDELFDTYGINNKINIRLT